jgi:peroxiredoxin
MFAAILLLLSTNMVAGKKKAIDFTLTDINGGVFNLYNCSSEIVLLDFFGTNCPPCITEVSTLRALYTEYPRNQLEIVSISYEDVDVIRNFALQHNMEWFVLKGSTEIFLDYGVGPIPRTFLVDNDGYICYDHLGWTGQADAIELRSEIDAILSGTNNDNSDNGSDGDSGTSQPGPPYMLIAGIVLAVIFFCVVGIVVAGQVLQWSKPAKKRRPNAHSKMKVNSFDRVKSKIETKHF